MNYVGYPYIDTITHQILIFVRSVISKLTDKTYSRLDKDRLMDCVLSMEYVKTIYLSTSGVWLELWIKGLSVTTVVIYCYDYS